MTHTVGGVFVDPEDIALYDEMLRLQGLGSNTPTGVPYTEDEIMAIVRGASSGGTFPRGHIPGVGRVLPGQRTVIPPPSQGTHLADIDRLKKREKLLTKEVNMFKRLFMSDYRFSQMLTQLESQLIMVVAARVAGAGMMSQETMRTAARMRRKRMIVRGCGELSPGKMANVAVRCTGMPEFFFRNSNVQIFTSIRSMTNLQVRVSCQLLLWGEGPSNSEGEALNPSFFLRTISLWVVDKVVDSERMILCEEKVVTIIKNQIPLQLENKVPSESLLRLLPELFSLKKIKAASAFRSSLWILAIKSEVAFRRGESQSGFFASFMSSWSMRKKEMNECSFRKMQNNTPTEMKAKESMQTSPWEEPLLSCLIGGFHSPTQTKSALQTVLDSRPSHGSQTQPVVDPGGDAALSFKPLSFDSGKSSPFGGSGNWSVSILIEVGSGTGWTVYPPLSGITSHSGGAVDSAISSHRLSAITSSSGNNKRCAPSPLAVVQNPTTPEWMVQSPPTFHTFRDLPAIKETKSSVKRDGDRNYLDFSRNERKKETGSRKNRRLGSRKSARRIPKGFIHVQASFNNTIVTVTDVRGRVVYWSSTVEQGTQRAEVMKKGPGLGIPSSKVRSHRARRPFDDPTSDVIPFCSLPVEYPNYSLSNSWMDHERFCLKMPIRNSQQDPMSKSLILIMLSLLSRKEATKPNGRSLLAFLVRDASLFVITALKMFSRIREDGALSSALWLFACDKERVN
nr:ribosomal protein S11, chloroplastic [Tanacetum cinerariifolium]